jgi:hypothetical protein
MRGSQLASWRPLALHGRQSFRRQQVRRVTFFLSLVQACSGVRMPMDGRPRELSQTFSKRRDAEKWQRHHEVSRDAGTLRRPSRQTTGQYLSRWLHDLTGIGGRTREDDENIVRGTWGAPARNANRSPRGTASRRRWGLSPAPASVSLPRHGPGGRQLFRRPHAMMPPSTASDRRKTQNT